MLHLSSVTRLGAVALASVGMMGASAGVASADSIREGSTTVLPTATSPVVPVGTLIGATGLSGSATFTSPTGSGSCTAGNLRGTIVTQNPGTATDVTLSTNNTTANNSLNINTCTDNVPNVDLRSIQLSNTPTIGVNWLSNASNTNNGQLLVPASGTSPNATFNVVIVAGGSPIPCPVVAVNNPIVGRIDNGSLTANPPGPPSVTFTNVVVRTTAAPGSTCETNIGDNSPAGNTSTITVKFHPLRNLANNNYIGVFN